MPASSQGSGPLDAVAEHTGSARCLNCGELLQGEYCHRCGQQDRPVTAFFPTLVLEALEGLFAFESKTWLTLWYLISRPAWLTREYLAGRRVRYLPPARLFITFVLLFLFTLSLELFLDSVGVDLDQQPEQFDTAVDEDVTSEEDLAEFESGVLQLIDHLRLPFLSEQNNRQFVALLQERAVTNIAAINEDPLGFFSQMLEYLPVLLLLMIPLLALMQKLAYLGSGRYYIEHLLLTIHNHSFLFLVFVLVFVLDLLAWMNLPLLSALAGIVESLLNLWAAAYLYLSLRLFFGQGYLLTAAKFLAMSIAYGVLLISAIIPLSLVSFFFYQG